MSFRLSYAVVAVTLCWIPALAYHRLSLQGKSRLLVGVISAEGLGVSLSSLMKYLHLASATGRKLVLTPMQATKHYGDAKIDLADYFTTTDGSLLPNFVKST